MNTSFGCTAHKQAVEIVRVVACKNYSALSGMLRLPTIVGLKTALKQAAAVPLIAL